MKSILVCGLLFCIIGLITFVTGQERKREENGATQSADAKATNDQIEVKTDRFSNETSVVLKPQLILDKPDHQLTMKVETKLGEKKSFDWERDMIMAIVEVESQTKGAIDRGDYDLHFLIDGKPPYLDSSNFRANPYAERYGKLRPGFTSSTSFSASFNRSDLERIAKARRIEMRLGPIELLFNQTTVQLLGDYAKQVLAQHEIAGKRKP